MQRAPQDLISDYFIRQLSDSELQELKRFLDENPHDRKTFEEYRLIFEIAGQNSEVLPIDVELALAKTKSRLFFSHTMLVRLLLQAAAVLIFAILFASTYIYFTPSLNKTESPEILQEITTIYGTRAKFQLSDGTKVCLNSGSKLVFPVKFSGNMRKVQLTGEAYFEVTTNQSKPFIVKTNEMNVKVLGTSFNLQAYPESSEINTTLLHGKVILEIESDGKTEQLAELKPLDRAKFNAISKSITISQQEAVYKDIAWKDGKLVFYNDPIEKVAEKLGIWYNVTVTINRNELKKFRFTATFTDEPIDQVLELLCKSSPLRYQIKKSVRLADDSYSKREIILY